MSNDNDRMSDGDFPRENSSVKKSLELDSPETIIMFIPSTSKLNERTLTSPSE